MSKPLQGVRVVDNSIMWAGPYLSNLLATLGADVIKVESIHRLDPWRMSGGIARSVDQWWEKSPFFNAVNCNKRSLTLDLAQPDGVALFKELTAVSDIVVENFTARVMPKLGLDYPKLREINPKIIMISLPAYGSTGPWRDYPGFAKNIEQMAGIPQITGHPDGPPLMSAWEGFTDPAAGVNGAVAVLTALLHRQMTGQGQYIDLSQVEAMTCMVGDAVVGYSMNGDIPKRLGNRHPGMAPHGYYRCRDGRWIGLSVADDADWTALVNVMGRPDWATKDLFSTSSGRLDNQDELDRSLEQWTQAQDNYELMNALQNAGVAAGAFLTNEQFFDDPHLKARGTFARVTSPCVGEHTFPVPTTPVRLSKGELSIERPAPRLGEHNFEILTSLLGKTAQQVAAWEERNVIGTRPVTR